MNDKKTNKHLLTIEMIVVGIILFAVVYIFVSKNGDQDLAAAAANARIPLGEAVRTFMNKLF